jgi:hypothetical protein
MDIQMIEDGTHIAELAQRFQKALAAVNARIVFLAGYVGARLDLDGEVQHILDRANPAFRQGVAHHSANHGGHASQLAHRAWEELRGLMVLRCELVKHALETLGLSVTHQITSQVERALERKGIKPGADGFDLHLQMDRIVCNDLTP